MWHVAVIRGWLALAGRWNESDEKEGGWHLALNTNESVVHNSFEVMAQGRQADATPAPSRVRQKIRARGQGTFITMTP